jgi:hypothetical protein
VLGAVNRRENWKTWERRGENLDYPGSLIHGVVKTLIIRRGESFDNQGFHNQGFHLIIKVFMIKVFIG